MIHSYLQPTVFQYLFKRFQLFGIQVVDITDNPSVARDLALIKVRTSDGQARSEVLQIVDTFRARVVDVALKSLMVEVTGTEDKVDGLAEVLRPFGIIEMVRTGRVAMMRGSDGDAGRSS